MSERQTGICISWEGKYGFVMGQSGEKFFVLPRNVPPNEAGEMRLWPDEEIEFTPVAQEDSQKYRLVTEIEFITRVPWEPLDQAEGKVDQWKENGYGYINAGLGGYYFFHIKDVLLNDNGGRIPPYVGQTVVFDTAIDRDRERVQAINVRLLF
jgi:hypothetical protein